MTGTQTGCLMTVITQQIEWAGTLNLTQHVTKYQNNVTNKYTLGVYQGGRSNE